jgi:hypothetical protein
MCFSYIFVLQFSEGVKLTQLVRIHDIESSYRLQALSRKPLRLDEWRRDRAVEPVVSR